MRRNARLSRSSGIPKNCHRTTSAAAARALTPRSYRDPIITTDVLPLSRLVCGPVSDGVDSTPGGRRAGVDHVGAIAGGARRQILRAAFEKNKTPFAHAGKNLKLRVETNRS